MKLILQRTTDGQYLEGWRVNDERTSTTMVWTTYPQCAFVLKPGMVLQQTINPLPSQVDLRLVDLEEKP